MKLNDYQDEARKTAIYPVEDALTYTALGLCGESGEVAEKIKKWIRGDDNGSSLKENLLYELGDVLWYISNLCTELNFNLEDVALQNLEKLKLRASKGKISGSGDDR